LRDLRAHREVFFSQANAVALPFADHSSDLVVTVLALEQMEEIRARALSEIARVAGRFVLMIEPFRDWNADGHRRDYIVANDYFSAAVWDLKEFGLDPVAVYADIPNKLSFAVGLVLARVA